MALGVETIRLILRMLLSSLTSFTRYMAPTVLVINSNSYSSQSFVQTRRHGLVYSLSESEIGLLWANNTHGNAGVSVADNKYGFRSHPNFHVGHKVVNFLLHEIGPVLVRYNTG